MADSWQFLHCGICLFRISSKQTIVLWMALNFFKCFSKKVASKVMSQRSRVRFSILARLVMSGFIDMIFWMPWTCRPISLGESRCGRGGG